MKIRNQDIFAVIGRNLLVLIVRLRPNSLLSLLGLFLGVSKRRLRFHRCCCPTIATEFHMSCLFTSLMLLLSTWCGVTFMIKVKAETCFSENVFNLCHKPFMHIWNNFCWKKCLMAGKWSCGHSIEIMSKAATAASHSVGCSINSINCWVNKIESYFSVLLQ